MKESSSVISAYPKTSLRRTGGRPRPAYGGPPVGQPIRLRRTTGVRWNIVRVSGWKPIILYGLILLGATFSSGCSTHNAPPNMPVHGEYKKLIERQRVQQESAGVLDAGKFPDMTAHEYECLGDHYLQQNNMDMAFTQYDKALNLEQGNNSVRYKIGCLFLKKGLPHEAGKEFKEILKKDPGYALAYEGLGFAYFKMGDYKSAKENLLSAIRLNDRLWQAHNLLGIVYNLEQQFGAAVNHYRAAIALQPDKGLLYNNLGLSHYLKGEYGKAIEAFVEALKIEPSNRKVYNNMALVLSKAGRYEEALSAFKKGEEEAVAYNNMGYIYLTHGIYEEAIKAFEKAIELSPKFYTKASENLKRAKRAKQAAIAGHN